LIVSGVSYLVLLVFALIDAAMLDRFFSAQAPIEGGTTSISGKLTSAGQDVRY
jgi:hypothetical protein